MNRYKEFKESLLNEKDDTVKNSADKKAGCRKIMALKKDSEAGSSDEEMYKMASELVKKDRLTPKESGWIFKTNQSGVGPKPKNEEFRYKYLNESDLVPVKDLDANIGPKTVKGAEKWLKSNGIKSVVVDDNSTAIFAFEAEGDSGKAELKKVIALLKKDGAKPGPIKDGGSSDEGEDYWAVNVNPRKPENYNFLMGL